MPTQKLYCYVDETGQDGLQKFFLVSIIITDHMIKDGIEEKLQQIETKTGKNKTKWTKEEFQVRLNYLSEVAKLTELQASIFYSFYKNTKEYTHLTSLSVAKAVLQKKEKDYSVTVIIDGLTKADTEKVRRELKQLHIKYSTIRGMKDEQSAFLRLADSMAGFIRDYIEKSSYAEPLFKRFLRRKIIIEAK